jgi:DNA processing protein
VTAFPVLYRGREGFPGRLAQIYDPPKQLYVRGAELDVLYGPCIGLVGSRSCSSYGAHVARMLGRELAAAGAVVVSGLARGIDGEAHRGALEAGGVTVAVLGCGIDRDYPASHAGLARRIAETGLIVSEYPPGTEPAPWRFPARNRIVAGLCSVIVVIEARERSGALITAEFALEEGREVLAVPGEITSSLSAGTNGLLRQGAAPLLSADDALAAAGLERPPQQAPEPGGSAASVLAELRNEPAGADSLARRTGLDVATVSAALVELELAGLVSGDEGVYRGSM